jgi:UDP-N-acetylglucosamine acyltransferase
MAIHSTAVIDPRATLGEHVEIGAYSVVEAEVTIGDGCVIDPFVVIHPYTSLGAGCRLAAGVILGGTPQDAKFQGERSYLRIGRNTEIREYATLHRATGEEAASEVGESCLIMAYAHLGHNCQVGSNVLISNTVAVAGHCVIEDHVTVGGLAALHQFVSVGEMAMIGGLSRIVRDVPPYMLVEGNPSRPRAVNVRGLARHGVTEESREQVERAYRLLFRSSYNVGDALEQLEQEYPEPERELRRLLDFMRRVDEGYRGRQLNPH